LLGLGGEGGEDLGQQKIKSQPFGGAAAGEHDCAAVHRRVAVGKGDLRCWPPRRRLRSGAGCSGAAEQPAQLCLGLIEHAAPLVRLRPARPIVPIGRSHPE